MEPFRGETLVGLLENHNKYQLVNFRPEEAEPRWVFRLLFN